MDPKESELRRRRFLLFLIRVFQARLEGNPPHHNDRNEAFKEGEILIKWSNKIMMENRPCNVFIRHRISQKCPGDSLYIHKEMEFFFHYYSAFSGFFFSFLSLASLFPKNNNKK